MLSPGLNPSMEPVFLSRQQVRQMLGNISYESLNRYVADGVIPRPVRFGSRDNAISGIETHSSTF
jgi:hypothetical protein